MVDTIRTETELLTNLFQEGQPASSISEQDMRDLIVSLKTFNLELVTGQANPSHKEGMLFYDDTHKALSYYNENSEVTINLGQEMVLRVQNISGVDITDGDVVYISGISNGDIPLIIKAISSSNTPNILGVATSIMLDGEIGYVTVFGLVHSVDTSSWVAGDTLYLSDSVAGELVTIAPTLPNETIVIGTVLNSTVDGHILVRTQRINFSNETTVFSELVNTNTITAALPNTAYAIAFNNSTGDENITHSNTVDNSEVTVEIAGVYNLSISAQVVHTGGGASVIRMWIQHDFGGGWVNWANSGFKQDLSNNDTNILALNHTDRHVVGDKWRVMWSTSNVNASLPAEVAGIHAAIPSVRMVITRTGIE